MAISAANTTFQNGTTAPMGGSLLNGCAFCNSPTGKQAAFFVAICLFVICWHTHLYSVLE